MSYHGKDRWDDLWEVDTDAGSSSLANGPVVSLVLEDGARRATHEYTKEQVISLMLALNNALIELENFTST